MASITDLLEKVFTLTSSVEGLKEDISKMSDLVLDHHTRIARLEADADLTAEKAKSASLASVLQSNNALVSKISEIEQRVSGIENGQNNVKRLNKN